MKYFLAAIALVVAVVHAEPYFLGEDEDGKEYYVIPAEELETHHRSRRQTQAATGFNLNSKGILDLHHKGTIFENNAHKLQGMAHAAKDLKASGIRPEVIGGALKYNHIPSGSNLGVGANNIHGYGTDVKASGTWNIIHQKNAQVGVTGEYGRHFGGPYGTGRPNWGVFLGGRYNF